MRISWPKLGVLVAMSIFGLWASTMVVVVYYTLRQNLPFCPASSGPSIVFNCGTVLSSSYSMIFGIPLEVFAVAYFVVNLVLIYFVTFASGFLGRFSFRTLFAWRFLGIMIVPYLLYIELVVLRAVCVYCTMMHVAIIADFIIISYFLFLNADMRGFIMQPPPPTGEASALTK
jgi:uncharacterized membrane protein